MTRCPACGSTEISIFYEVAGVPAHSCVLLDSREEALAYPTGDIRLAFCGSCGFIANVAFDRDLLDYSQDYEETQGFSGRFNAFARSLAHHLIDRYEVRGKRILEIGSGKGEFLTLLCELGGNRGVGIDPAFVPERMVSEAADRMTFIRDYFGPGYTHLSADLVVCRHTLEHIPDVAEFVRLTRRTVDQRRDVITFFEIPDTRRVLRELAFWDIYHEHCSYFTPGSLGRLFRSSGFDILDLRLDFDDQYLLIEAAANGETSQPSELEEGIEELGEEVETFRREHAIGLERWRAELDRYRSEGRTAAIWGSGSKGVAFLTTLGIRDEIELVVDINPFKHGKRMAGTGQEIVAPRSLVEHRPDTVIVMNPIYVDEIRAELGEMGLSPELTTVESVAQPGTRVGGAS